MYQLKILEGLNDEEILKSLRVCDYEIKRIGPNEYIHRAGDICNYVGIIINGEVSVEDREGNTRTLEKYDLFGDITLYSNKVVYDYSIRSDKECKIIELDKFNFLALLGNFKILRNYVYQTSTVISEYMKKEQVDEFELAL